MYNAVKEKDTPTINNERTDNYGRNDLTYLQSSVLYISDTFGYFITIYIIFILIKKLK